MKKNRENTKMNPMEVIIKNWPSTNFLTEYAPIIIALIALCVSLYSVNLTRKSFVASHRPYVWAASYAVIDEKVKTIIPIPFKVMGRVKNAPAKIIKFEFIITFNSEMLFKNTIKGSVRFPDEKSEWSYSMGKVEFDKIMNRPNDEKGKLHRYISIEYSSLGGNEKYFYRLEQVFVTDQNEWSEINEEAN